MNAQDLKNSILQLAIQGKLVEQRAEEGTAKELIEKIKAEKEQLIKDKKIKKEKALPEITEDEIPFEIPESWEWMRLGEVLSVYGGKRIPAGRKLEEKDTGHMYIRVADMKNGSISLNNIKFIPEDIYEKIKSYTISKDDIYITVAGTIGQVGTVPEQLDNANLTENADKLKVYLNDKKYIYYMMSSELVQHQIRNFTTKVGQPKLAIIRIQSLIIPLPPLEEQKRIVAKIEELMPYIEQYDKAYTKVEALNKKFPEDMQKSILQYAIQGKLVEQRAEEGTAEELYKQIQEEKAQLIKDKKIKKEKALPEITEEEIPFEIPESWKWVRFRDICAVLTCGYASTPKYVSKEEGMPFISAKNIKPYKFMPENHNYISKELYEKLTQTCNPEIGDILLTRVGAGIGEAAIIDKNIKFAIYVSLTLIKLVNYNLIDNKFVLFWLNSPIGVKSSQNNIFGKNSSQGNLNVNNVRNFLFPLPPLEEQKRIVAKIEELLPYCKQLIK